MINYNLFFCFMRFKSKNLVDCLIVFSLISRPINSLDSNPHSHRQLPMAAEKNLESSNALHYCSGCCMETVLIGIINWRKSNLENWLEIKTSYGWALSGFHIVIKDQTTAEYIVARVWHTDITVIQNNLCLVSINMSA